MNVVKMSGGDRIDGFYEEFSKDFILNKNLSQTANCKILDQCHKKCHFPPKKYPNSHLHIIYTPL